MDKSVDQLIASANDLRDSARFNESAEMLRQALRLDPNRADVHNDLGVLLHLLGQLDEAEQRLMEARRLAPGHVDPPLNLGNLLAARGRLREAVQWYERVLAIDPNHAVAVNNRAIVLQDMGLVDAAPAEFERALRLSSANVMVWSNWLMALTRTSHRHDPALATGRITFGSFNGLPKLSDATVHLWSSVLSAVARSRLIIKPRAAIDDATRDINLDRFVRCGIARDRIELRGGGEASFNEHLRSYSEIDLALDPFPYHGTMTTCEALFMGVPAITLAGSTHVSRVGVSLLNTIGLSQLIAQNEYEFGNIAVQHAANLEQLSELRASLRHRVLASALRDEKAYARAIESALRDVWRKWCER